MWETELGVTVTLNNQERAVFLQTRKDGDYSIARNGWIGDYNDPMTFLDMWLTGGGNNDAQYVNPEYDELYICNKLIRVFWRFAKANRLFNVIGYSLGARVLETEYSDI